MCERGYFSKQEVEREGKTYNVVCFRDRSINRGILQILSNRKQNNEPTDTLEICAAEMFLETFAATKPVVESTWIDMGVFCKRCKENVDISIERTS